ncbi:HIG1 domain-containing protein [Parasphingorhabdus sp. DH2-15]|uniref:HIG1 domain-containing protein n=1 Tax=Parasphingorhabdus sp. DH2-15 TaxID=3444112 RepID=UPI003F68769C
MNIFLVILFVIIALMVVFALVRGLIAFLRMTKEDLENPGITKSHQMQNKMMFARVKYQAIAVGILVVLMLVAQSG